MADRPILWRMIQRLRLCDLNGPQSHDLPTIFALFLNELNLENAWKIKIKSKKFYKI